MAVVYDNRRMFALKADVAKILMAPDNSFRKGPLAANPILARYEYAVPMVLNADRTIAAESAKFKSKVCNMDMCDLCTDITETIGKQMKTGGDAFALSKKIYVHFFADDSIALRICTSERGGEVPYCTVSIHRIENEKQVEALWESGWNRTDPGSEKTGKPLGIRHPGDNAGKDVNVGIVHECMAKMFRNSEFAQNFLDAKVGKN